MNQFMNMDPQEVAKFDALAGQWWDPQGKMAMLQVINPLRLAFIHDHGPLQDQRILDVGCGGGILSEALAHAGAQVVGIDQSKAALAVAQEHAQENNLAIDYRWVSVEQLALDEPGTFDLLTCMELLEHVPDPKSIVTACARLLKPQGRVVFATINRTFKAWLWTIVGGEYLLGLLPRGTHSFTKFIRPQELEVWAKDQDLQSLASASLKYNLLTKTMSLVRGQADVNYMLSFARRK